MHAALRAAMFLGSWDDTQQDRETSLGLDLLDRRAHDAAALLLQDLNVETLDCSVSILCKCQVRTVRGVLARLAGSKGLSPLAVGPLLGNTRSVEALLDRRRASGKGKLDHEGGQDKVTVTDDLARNARRGTVNHGL